MTTPTAADRSDLQGSPASVSAGDIAVNLASFERHLRADDVRPVVSPYVASPSSTAFTRSISADVVCQLRIVIDL
jgi:hypothetical protein